MSGVGHLVQSGPLLLAMPVAAAAGAITFLSPCCLPLVPGYLSYITGMSASTLTEPPGADARSTGPAAETAVPTGAAAHGAASGSLSDSALSGGARSGGAIAAGAGPASVTGAGPASVTGAGPAIKPGAARTTRARPARQRAGRGRAVAGTALFVLGFSAVFTAEGGAFGVIGQALRTHQRGLAEVLGCVIIALGLLFAGAFDRFTFAGRIVRPSVRPRAGLAGAPLVGVLFGLGWTPCIGPTLAVVLALGATTGTASRGALLAFVYGIGLGIPFLMVAFAVQRGMSLFGFARRHARQITRIGGVMLIVVGLLEVTGAWATAVTWLQVHWLSGYVPPL